MDKRIGHWIGGRPPNDTSGRSAPVHDPATGRHTVTVDLAPSAEVDRAVGAARLAWREWRQTPLSRRAAVMVSFRKLLHHSGNLAAAVTAEHGKVLSDAAGEVARGLTNMEFATGITHLIKGQFSDQVSTGIDVYSIRQPLGVVAGITLCNFTMIVPLWMCANAIACGNSFIRKPSEKDPSPLLTLAELWQQAGLPDGVFTVIQGDGTAVDSLIEHPSVAALSFVGSTPVAKHIYEAGTAQDKRVQALGGAKNHMVVLPDADINLVADAAVSAAFGSAGERCMAISVVVAVGGVGDAPVQAIADRIPKLRIGPDNDFGTEMGPLITAAHRDRVAGYVDTGAGAGAEVVVDGGKAELFRSGFFLGASLLDHVEPGMAVYTDEMFGPVLSVVRRETFDQALEIINANEFANGTAVFTCNGGPPDVSSPR